MWTWIKRQWYGVRLFAYRRKVRRRMREIISS